MDVSSLAVLLATLALIGACLVGAAAALPEAVNDCMRRVDARWNATETERQRRLHRHVEAYVGDAVEEDTTPE